MKQRGIRYVFAVAMAAMAAAANNGIIGA